MRNTIDIQIGWRVAKYRKRASVNSDVAARRCGLSRDDYLASEQGERRFQADELFELARFFDVGYATFFTRLTLG
ncbi:MAG: transcriptional regulator with XRE-family HTH domain [Alphaproteobacteria bacterium]|jgi:transcriptional regulator with XRE-family HTH domain